MPFSNLNLVNYQYYYQDNNWANCKYVLDYEANIDGTVFEHTPETLKADPENCVKRIFEIVAEFNNLYVNSTNTNFINNLKAAGYKKQ